MTPILQIGDRKISNDNIFPLLQQYGILPQLVKEIITENAIAQISISPEESKSLYQEFYQSHQLNSDEEIQGWLAMRNLSRQNFDYTLIRNAKLEKYKQQTWGNKLESYFIERKAKLDKVVYSLIRVKDIGLAQELYFRIQEGEQSFAEIARDYSLGTEANTGGLLGPVELSVPHPALANILTSSQPHQLIPPTRLGEWILIIRLEKKLPAQLDEQMKQKLLHELFDTYLQNQLQSFLAKQNHEIASTNKNIPSLA